MSDADDQMGGTGGETGPKPGQDKPEESTTAGSPGGGGDRGGRDQVTEDSEQSFPASDPPAHY